MRADQAGSKAASSKRTSRAHRFLPRWSDIGGRSREILDYDSIRMLHVGGDDVFSDGKDFVPPDLLGSFRVFRAVTPATRHTTHCFWPAGHDWDHADPSHAAKVATRLIRALREDVSATNYIEQMIAKVGERSSELLVRADNICVLRRRAFERLIQSEQMKWESLCERS